MSAHGINSAPGLRRRNRPGRLPVGPTLRRRRTEWLVEALYALGAALGAAVVGVCVVNPRLQPLLLLGLAAVGLALVFRFPFFFTCIVLVLVASVLGPGRFKLPVGPLDLRLEELVLGALLVVAIVRPRRSWWGGRPGHALIGFFGVLAASALLAMLSGRVAFSDAFATSRMLAPLLLFFVIVRLFPESRQVRLLLLVAAVLAAVTGLVAMLVAAPGSPLTDILNPDGNSSIRDKEGSGLVNRVRLPGVALAYGLFWYAAVQAASQTHRQRLGWLVLMAGMGVSLALSFNRNMWIGIVLGLVLMVALSRRPTRTGVALVLVGLVAGGATIALSGRTVDAKSPIYPIIERGTTLTNPAREAQDSSLQDRAEENRAAVTALSRHPLTGVGPGASYGKVGTERTAAGTEIRAYQRFIHNQYLHILLIGGPLALITFLLFLGHPVLAVRKLRGEDDSILALAVGVVLVLVSAIVMLTFVDPTFIALDALLVAAFTVLGFNARNGSDSSPRPSIVARGWAHSMPATSRR